MTPDKGQENTAVGNVMAILDHARNTAKSARAVESTLETPAQFTSLPVNR
jgi:hypothetical protein